MNDTELRQFLAKHRRPDGAYDLPVDGWDKLPKEERNHLADRLKAQEQGLAQSPTACSCPLDLDDLDARLLQVPTDNSFSLRAEPQDVERPDLDDLEYTRTMHEVEAYRELINAGGRPTYPIDLIQEVFRDPDNYTGVLRPWQATLDGEVHPEKIFQRQSRRWQDFRKWQNDNRGLEDDDGGFLGYVEAQKHRIKQTFLPDRAAERLAEIEADTSCLKSGWGYVQWEREEQRYRCRERGCHGFHDYADAVNRRLARHDFTRPFQLHEDPKQQDKLTTWIEYLNYEYWWLDKYTRDMQRLEPAHDMAWQELVDDKLLRPHDTKESVRTMAYAMRDQSEEDEAKEAVRRLEDEGKRIYALTQKDPRRSRISRAKRISILQSGTTKLLAAKRRLNEIRNRNDRITKFIRGTFAYTAAKKNAALLSELRLPWVLEQIPLIEAEQNRSPNREAEGLKTKTLKRSRAAREDEEKQRFKKQKLDQQEPEQPTRGRSPRVTSKTRSERPIMTGPGAYQGDHHRHDAEPKPWVLRRSPRIAARRDTPRDCFKPVASRPRRRPELGSRPPAQLSAAQPKVSASMGRQMRSVGRGGVVKPAATPRGRRRRPGG